MATASGSRWANHDSEDHEAIEKRKRDKEEKKRLKDMRLQQHTARSTSQRAVEHVEVNGDETRPVKRQKLQEKNESLQEIELPTRLVEFPTMRFGPCKSVTQYYVLNNIEEGSYGYVSRARQKVTDDVVALKKLKMEHKHDGFPVTGLREIQILMASNHTNVIGLREVVKGESLNDVNSIYLVLDFVEHDLKTLLDDMLEPFLPSETKTLMHQLISGTNYLHNNYILHRDLKTSNLLLSNRGELKIADFGMARYTSSPPPSNLTQLVVTLWYRAPELLLGTTVYDSTIDVWSIGCIFAELLTRKPLFQDVRNEVGALSSILKLLGMPTNDSWPDFRSLPNARALVPVLSTTKSSKGSLRRDSFPHLTSAGMDVLSSCLTLDPSHRLSASTLLRHDYFIENPRMKPKEFFPTFPSKAGQEKRRRVETPQAPVRGKKAPKLHQAELKEAFSSGAGLGDDNEEQPGAGFALQFNR